VSEGQGLTVRELATESGLGLVLLTERTALGRAIEGVHHSDLRDPTPWMGKGSILITHGSAFADAPSEAVAYLDRIAEKGTVALVVGVGPYIDRVDERMLAHARRLNIAVFEAPLSVSFRQVFAYVYSALTSSDMHRMRRALAVHEQLLDILLDEGGMDEMLARLSGIIEMALVLYDTTGVVVAKAGQSGFAGLPPERIWALYTAAGGDLGPLGVLEAEHGRVYARRVAVHGTVERVLAAVARQPPISEFADMALAFAQRVIGLDLLKHREAAIQRRRMRAVLLYDFLATDECPEDVRQRLLEQGVDLAKRWRVTFVRLNRPQGMSAQMDEPEAFKLKNDAASLLEQLFAARGIASICTVKGEGVVCLLVLGPGDLRLNWTRALPVRSTPTVATMYPRGTGAPICPAIAGVVKKSPTAGAPYARHNTRAPLRPIWFFFNWSIALAPCESSRRRDRCMLRRESVRPGAAVLFRHVLIPDFRVAPNLMMHVDHLSGMVGAANVAFNEQTVRIAASKPLKV
jgi:hypothetical protein